MSKPSPPCVKPGQPLLGRLSQPFKRLGPPRAAPPEPLPPHAPTPAPPPMQPPGLEGLLPPGGFSSPQPRVLPPAPPGPSPPPAMNPGYPPEAPPEPPKAPPGAAPLPYGYFGSGYYSCRVARGSLKGPQGAFPEPKFLEPPGAAHDELQGRAAEFAFYPGYGSPYQPVAGYLDVSVVPALGEPRPEALLPADGGCSPAWALGAGWGGQVCCGKEQGQPGFLLKPALADSAGPCPSESLALRRPRKKRVPYSKGQLRELEREFSASRFITRERRRRISAATSLSERQVTIWFQNRRVKDKKGAAKGRASAAAAP